MRLWQQKNREQVNETARLWRQQNPDKFREILRRYRENHREAIRENARKAREKRLKQIKEYEALWRALNPEKKKAENMAKDLPYAPSCELCGSEENLVKHHPNYDEPLVVVTMCRVCHGVVHAE